MRTLSHIVVLAGLTAWLSCLETMEPVSGPAVRVLVHPAGMSISGVGHTAAFSVVALNAQGDTIASPAVTWSSLNPHVVTIDAGGKATAVGSGQVTVAVGWRHGAARGPLRRSGVTLSSHASVLTPCPPSAMRRGGTNDFQTGRNSSVKSRVYGVVAPVGCHISRSRSMDDDGNTKGRASPAFECGGTEPR